MPGCFCPPPRRDRYDRGAFRAHPAGHARVPGHCHGHHAGGDRQERGPARASCGTGSPARGVAASGGSAGQDREGAGTTEGACARALRRDGSGYLRCPPALRARPPHHEAAAGGAAQARPKHRGGVLLRGDEFHRHHAEGRRPLSALPHRGHGGRDAPCAAQHGARHPHRGRGGHRGAPRAGGL